MGQSCIDTGGRKCDEIDDGCTVSESGRKKLVLEDILRGQGGQ